MTIKYKFLEEDYGVLKINTDLPNVQISIPFDSENIDYQEYLEWAKTNTTDPAD